MEVTQPATRLTWDIGDCSHNCPGAARLHTSGSSAKAPLAANDGLRDWSGHGLARRHSASDIFSLMADSDIKALTEALPGENFETTAFTTPPPLADATVAIVTTASLHHPDQDDFAVMDAGYRVLDDSRRDYVTGHWSPNFDGSGFAYDMNTVFPVDRLDELAERGVIGRVADQHLAYAGNQFDLSAIRMDSGPAGARFLRDQGVDVVLLTPV